MDMNDTGMIYYRLQPGPALTALRGLLKEQTAFLKNLHKQNPHAKMNDHYEAFYAHVEQTNPDLLEALGFEAPATMVMDYAGIQRAYKHYPRIAAIRMHDGKTRFYLGSPVDYTGGHFEPQGAKRLGAQEARAVDTFITENPTRRGILFPRNYTGTALPVDYTSTPREEPSAHYELFLAQGKTLDILDNLEQRKSAFSNGMKKLTDSVLNVFKNIIPAISLTIEAVIKPAFGNRPQFVVKTNADLPKSNHFEYGQTLDNQTTITYNARTEDGASMRDAFETVSLMPSLSDYPDLKRWGKKDYPYMVQDMDGLQFLQYTSRTPATMNFCPPDSMKIGHATMMWMEADKRDRMLGITPPPATGQVAEEIRKVAEIRKKTGQNYEPVNKLAA